MVKISLRAYNREIETLVDRGQSEEAIAHCKFILKTYPKHIDTYRLLGKAFLEAQLYTEAADILQRILSVQPDDFVSQIGMSIIREDEGNLDAALFHMERAFEIQPSNAGVQDELRRLYGRRDGVEPPKLRLTRGALVRMYARGDLYRQAIAEAKAALVEDNQRIDIDVILAKMYFLMGQKTEAAAISSKLVRKLPFCYEANHILAEVLPETSRSEDAKIYQQRLLALDPYLGYISESSPTIAQVPDQTVTINRLEWTPSMQTDQEPAWSKSLGITIEAREEEIAEDWFTPFSVPSETSQPEATAPQPPSEDAELANTPVSDQISPADNQTQEPGSETEEIPDWMSSAGWGVSEHPVEEPLSFDSVEPQPVISEEPEPVPAEMPDWLKDFAPTSEPVTNPAEDQEKLDWLGSILPAESSPTNEDQEIVQPNLEIPTPSSPPEVISPVNEDLPDWMRSGVTASEEPSNLFEFSEEPLPDWLTETTEQALPVEPVLSVETPETHEIVQNQPQELPQALISEPLADTIPISTQPADSEPAPEPDLSNVDDAMAWLESLAAKQGAGDESLLVSPEERLETPPDWVKEQAQEIGEDQPVIEPAKEPETEEWIPEWMKSPDESPAPAQDQTLPSQEMPDWLKALETAPDSTFNPAESMSETSIPLADLVSPSEPVAESGSADWIQEASLSSIEETPPPAAESPTSIEPKPSSEWKSYSTRKTGTLPSWLAASPPEEPPAPPEPVSQAAEEPSLPGWLLEEQPDTQDTGEAGISEPVSSDAPPLPEWLQNIEPESIDIPLPEAALASPTPAPVDIVFSSDPVELIRQAEDALSAGQIDSALTAYNTLVQNDLQIEETIHDLKDALYRYPVESSIWQTLGDALIRANRVQDALDAYTKAEELLK